MLLNSSMYYLSHPLQTTYSQYLNHNRMSKKQNSQNPYPTHSTSYSRAFSNQNNSYFAPNPKPITKPRYIHKQKTPTNNRIQLLQDESPLPYQYDHNKDTFRKVEDPSSELTSKSSIKQTLKINLKYQESLKENQELKKTIGLLKQELGEEKQHGEQSKKKFSSMIYKIVAVLESLKDSIAESQEEPQETLGYVERKIESVLDTLDQYPFDN